MVSNLPCRCCFFVHDNAKVLYGGKKDIDVVVESAPINGQSNGGPRELLSEDRSTTGMHTFTSEEPSILSFCFSNQMSTVAHKTIFFSVEGEEVDPVSEDSLKHHQTFTQMETSLINNHDSLRHIIDMQNHHRNRETSHRHTATYINGKINIVSACEAVLVLVLSFGQILYIRSLFSKKADRF